MIYLHDLLTFLRKTLDSVNLQLAEAPAGKLAAYVRGQKTQYFCEYTENGRRIRKTVTGDEKAVRGLARKEFLLIQLKILEKDIYLLEKAAKNYEEPSPETVFSKMKSAYQRLPRDYFFEEKPDTGEWAAAEYIRSGYNPEGKIHTTSRGLKVRSKSELIIAEILYAGGVPFRYEEVLTINNRRFAPDFTVMADDGQLFYWEHCGLTNNERYMAAHREKLAAYEKADIVPWKNLIVTYDEADGTLNIGIIESEIKNKLKRRST